MRKYHFKQPDREKLDQLTGGASEQACVALQIELQKYLSQHSVLPLSQIRYIAGVDLAYWKEGAEYAVCCIVIADCKTGEIVERVHAKGRISYPYIPGLLAFRELPLVLETAHKIQIQPDIYMFDGNGMLHPRHMGLATMAALYLGAPSLGVAKSYLKIADVEFSMPEEAAGSTTDITVNGTVLGRAVRTHTGVKPVFVSVGNWMDLDDAVAVTCSTVHEESHIPVPTREADLDTHRMREFYRAVR